MKTKKTKHSTLLVKKVYKGIRLGFDYPLELEENSFS